MLHRKLSLAILACIVTPAFAGEEKAQATGYVLANDGTKLVVMNDVKKGKATKTVQLKTAVSAIAWRPVTGDLLGFADGSIYKIDTKTGKMKSLAAQFADGTSIDDDAAVAFDFNNKIDAVRAVTSKGDNLVYFPKGFGDNDERAGSVLRFTTLAYAEDDAMAGKKPAIFANAYTNAISGAKASGTFQYALDANTDALVSLANNKGTLETIGQITVDGKPVDIMPEGGFDIVSPAEGENSAYAVLKLADASNAGLYSIDLATGAAKKIADLETKGVTGFAAAL